jgi:dipeptidyl aminopeptidase/acylaminoacyl peptidase
MMNDTRRGASVVLRRQVIAILLWAVPLAFAGRITSSDYYRTISVSDPRLSPDGNWIAFVATRAEERSDHRRTTIWLVAADGSTMPRRLTTAQNATHPRWMPGSDGVGFLSARPLPDALPHVAAKPQVYVLPLDGGEPRRLTNLKNGVTSFEFSPDGWKIACVSRTGSDDDHSSGREESDVRDYVYPFYKLDSAGWFDRRRSHIWIVDLKTHQTRQLTSGNATDDLEPRWSPDGTRLAYVARRLDGADAQTGDIWTIPAAGGEPMHISGDRRFPRSPRWSPDGARIAYIAEENASAVPKIWIAPAAGPGKSELATDEITFPSQIEWSDDGRALYADVPTRGSYRVFRVDLASRKATALTAARREVRHVHFTRGVPLMVYTASDATHPDDVYCARVNGHNERRLTNANRSLMDSTEFSGVEPMSYSGADGLTIEGFLLKPAGWQPGKTYPMILSIHGGPDGMAGFGWSEELQVFAAHGWAVFYTNPRGSTGYGEKFQRAVAREWGGKAYEDIVDGVDAALKKYPWIDPARLGVRGQSYGGFMTEWITTQTTRFRAAAALSGISDFVSDDGSRDGFYGHARDFGGDLFHNFDLYWKYSPVRYAQNVKTPTLVLHGANDQRVPLTQAEEWFRALKHFGVTSELVVFPREGHSIRS